MGVPFGFPGKTHPKEVLSKEDTPIWVRFIFLKHRCRMVLKGNQKETNHFGDSPILRYTYVREQI